MTKKYKIVFYADDKVTDQWKGYTSYSKVMKDYWSLYFANYYQSPLNKTLKVFSNESIV